MSPQSAALSREKSCGAVGTARARGAEAGAAPHARPSARSVRSSLAQGARSRAMGGRSSSCLCDADDDQEATNVNFGEEKQNSQPSEVRPLFTYENGATYHGSWTGDMRHGHGEQAGQGDQKST